jgi:hypothetical protein
VATSEGQLDKMAKRILLEVDRRAGRLFRPGAFGGPLAVALVGLAGHGCHLLSMWSEKGKTPYLYNAVRGPKVKNLLS